MRALGLHLPCQSTVFEPKYAGSKCLATRRHLMIPLVCAERCWAQAMELKTQQEEQPVPQKRQHQIRRLAKVSRLQMPWSTSVLSPSGLQGLLCAQAARWASQLAGLADVRCDVRSALEVDSYAAWLQGCHLQEKGDWHAALAKHARAQCAPQTADLRARVRANAWALSVLWHGRKLLEELTRVSAPEQQAVLAKQLADVTPAVRFCQYQIGKEGAAGRGASGESEVVPADADALQVPPQVLEFLVLLGPCLVLCRGQTLSMGLSTASVSRL